MRTLILIATLTLLAACTTYDVVKPDGTQVHVRSNRTFPNGIKVAYEGTDANGHTAKLQIDTGAVANQPSPFEMLGARVLDKYLGQILPAAPAAPATPSTPPPSIALPRDH